MSDSPPANCQECGGEKIKKIISKVGFQLKGTGWYETDFKNNDKGVKKETKSETDNKEKSDKKEKKTEDKGGSSTPPKATK